MRQDVGVLDELEGHRPAVRFLDLARRRILDPVVCDRRDRNEDIDGRRRLLHGIEHLQRGAHVDARHARWRRERDGAADQRDRRACLLRRPGDRIAHLAGEDTHRVHRLFGRARGDEHALAGERFRREERLDLRGNVTRLEHAAEADLAAGLVARRRAGDDDAVLAQAGNISLCRRVLPHLHVHGGRDEQRPAAREAQARQQVVGEAIGELGDEVRRCRGDRDELAVAREFDVAHGVADPRIPQIAPHRLAGKRLQSRRRDEARRRLRHRDPHVGSATHEQPRELGRLVGGDATGQPEQNLLAGQRHGQGTR